MTSRGKKLFIVTMVFIALMFIWILVAVLLTGGKDVGEFTPADKKIMTVFAVVEVTTIILTFVFSHMTGKENRRNAPVTKPQPQTQTEKTIRFRGICMFIAAYVLALGIMILGIITGKTASDLFRAWCTWLLWGCCGLAVLLLLMNLLLEKRYICHLERQQVRQLQQFVISHRDEAAKTAAQKYAFIKKWKLLTDLYALVFIPLGLCVAFCAGAVNSSFSSVLCMIAGLLILCTFSRIRFQPPASVFEEDKTYICREEFPRLHALVQRAADTIGCSGEIRIALLPDSNAGIAKIGDTYSILLGIVLLKTLSEEEVYHILLHEFSHMAQEKSLAQKEREYFHWLDAGKTPHFASGITNAFFSYFDNVYGFQFSLYMYAASIQIETTADQAMAREGNPETAASALLKIKYYDLFCWEKDGCDEPCLYTEPSPDKLVLTGEISRFHEAIRSRAQDWNQLMEKEILSRSASHPTMKIRLDALGVHSPGILPSTDTPDYLQECDKALTYLEELLHENRLKSYEEERKAYYLEPKAQVEAWEAAGKPLVAEEYADIIWGLRQLGRTKEAIDLCSQAIDTLPNAANHQGYFIRGCYLLHRFDEAGLEDIYFAIENNPNYIEEGLSTIGAFCCLTGNQKELDVYREKALDLAQKDKDEYSQVSVLNKNDRLSGEDLPEGMLTELLDYIHSIDTGCIEHVYLVRKTITDSFFTSAVVIRFDSTADGDVCNDILHKMFRYLDTCSDWQFSLFDYREIARVKVERIENSCIYSRISTPS